MEELRNKTLGVVGYGDIGQSAARIARAFGMKIIAMRRNPELSDQEKQECLTVRSPSSSLVGDPLEWICSPNKLQSSNDMIVRSEHCGNVCCTQEGTLRPDVHSASKQR